MIVIGEQESRREERDGMRREQERRRDEGIVERRGERMNTSKGKIKIPLQ